MECGRPVRTACAGSDGCMPMTGRRGVPGAQGGVRGASGVQLRACRGGVRPACGQRRREPSLTVVCTPAGHKCTAYDVRDDMFLPTPPPLPAPRRCAPRRCALFARLSACAL